MSYRSDCNQARDRSRGICFRKERGDSLPPSIGRMAALMGLAASLAGCERRDAATSRPAASGIVVFAAASTTELVERLGKAYEKRTGMRVTAGFGASSTLARQIEAGAPCDVFLSADPRWMDVLDEKGLLSPGTRRDLMSNDLVLVARRGNGLRIVFEPGFRLGGALKGRIAMGDPTHVPAGVYARQALERLGWWEDVQDRIIPTADVRAALRLVERGEVDAGIVYATDAAGADALEVVGIVPPHLHSPIRYTVAACRGAGHEADAFLRFLGSAEAQEIMTSLQFRPPAALPMSGPSSPR